MNTIDIYKTVLGDTWDLIAFKVYGDEKYMPYLMKANPEYLDIIYFNSNINLICPDIEIPLDESLPPWKRGD